MNRCSVDIIPWWGVLFAIVAILLNLTIESLSRQSLLLGVDFVVAEPRLFFYNAFLIFTTISVSFLFRHRIFVLALVSGFWLTLGIVNGAVLRLRMTPFSVADLVLLENGLSVLPHYLSTVEIIFLIFAVVILMAFFIGIFLIAPKKRMPVRYWHASIALLLIVALFFGTTTMGIQNKWLSSYFENLAFAYRDYGAPYCFMNTWLNRGIDQPARYSKSAVLNIFDEGVPRGIKGIDSTLLVDPRVGGEPERKPNILFVQLESFIDPLEINGLEVSADPIPNFRQLMEEESSGYLTVPSVGAGTANTEFEILTGMRIADFGPGEYPYKTILKETTCETISYILREHAYTAHGIHNHLASFYNRNEVYANLGFDTFTSVEYMNDVEKTPTNWAKDQVLLSEILTALESTRGPDFVFAVSVQGHGQYPEEPVYEEGDLAVCLKNPDQEGLPESNALEYFMQQLYEMDQFVGSLKEAVDEMEEETVVVFYGDHLPVLNLTAEKMKSASLFNTQYVMYANYGMRKVDQNLKASQLSAMVLERIGIQGGIIPWFHQTKRREPMYDAKLQMIGYDMLYGKKYLFNQSSPFEPTTLKMGIRDIHVDTILTSGSKTYIIGENFTPYSKLAINGGLVETTFVHPGLLTAEFFKGPLSPKDYSISQVGQYNTVLSTLEDVE